MANIAIENVTVDNWKRCVDHCERLQNEDYIKEGFRDQILEPIILTINPEDSSESEDDDDSLYEILTGRKPVPQRPESREGEEVEDVEWSRMDEEMQSMIADDMDMEQEQQYGNSVSMGSVGALDDTFREKRMTSRGNLDESGIDEMF